MSWVQEKIENVEMRQKGVIIKKTFNSIFLNDRAKNRPPQPRFLSFGFYLHSNYT